MHKLRPFHAFLLTAMRISFVQVLVCLAFAGISLAHEGQAQNPLHKEVTLQVREQTVRKILGLIERETDVKFVFSSRLIGSDRRASLDAQQQPLATVLDNLLGPLGLEYELSGALIVLRRKVKAELPVPDNGAAAAIPISGTVTGENGEGIPGVNVVLKGTSTGTVTSAAGTFSLNVPDGSGTLVFSFIGYVTEEVPINNRSTVNVSLVPDLKSLNEVVVVGYGTVKRSDLTGAVSSIKAEEIHRMPMTTLDQALQGRAAGVQVTQTDAAPGGTVSIRIRGGTSVNNSNEPLYVVDGFPVTDIRSLNPNDIESMEVLKDASATAIYGSRGANGVVIVTTKRAKNGQSQLNFDYYTGIQQLIKKIPLLNTQQFVELANEAFAYRKRPLPFPDPSAVTVDTDWQDEIFRTAPVSNYQLSFVKGSENSRYAVTGNYFNQDGIIVGSNFKRLSTRFNFEGNFSKRLKIGNNLQISYINDHAALVNTGGRGSAGVVHAALTSGPYVPVYDQEGNYFVDWQQIGPVFRRDNAVSLARETTNQRLEGRLLGNFYAEYEIAKGLLAKVSIGTDLRYNKHNQYITRNTYRGYFENGIAEINTGATVNWLNENTLSYSRQNGRHSVNLLAGYTMQRENSQFSIARGQGFVNDILTFNNLSAATTLQPSVSGAAAWSLQSYLGRVNYVYNDKYLFTASVRADGSSRFGANNKWGFFPSGAFAWRLSEENFIRQLAVFSDLKLRTSYGITGYQEIPLYRSLPALNAQSYILGDNLATGFAPSNIANPDLRWERTSQADIGVDMAFLNGRLRLTSDYYYMRTTDLLFNLEIPWSSGYSTSYQNIGSTENKGFELAVAADILTGGFKWTVDANYSQNRNKVLDLGGLQEVMGPESGFASFYSPGSGIIVRKGQPVNSFFGYINDGLFRTQQDIDNGPRHRYMELGDLRFRDTDNDGQLTPADRTIIGNAQPKFIYGLTNDFSWKGFDLNVFIQGVYGNDLLNVYRVYELESMRGTHNNHIRALDRYSAQNPEAYMPKADQRGQEQFISTRAIEDGSFIRLRNLVLGYNFPLTSLKVNWLKSLRLYVSGQNLITLTDYTGYDPEVNSHGQNSINQGIDYGAYPRAKTYMAGVKIGL